MSVERHWERRGGVWEPVDLIVPEHLVWKGPERGWEPVEDSYLKPLDTPWR